MFDPYPFEPIETDYIFDEGGLVYANERYVRENSPHTIYIPSRMVLFKIMRACIDISYPEYLWFSMNEDLIEKNQEYE